MEEYVSKNEIKPYKQLFASLIKKVRKDIKKEGITFTVNLVGSAKRNLVIRHHNKGFDCDYQVLIQKNKKSLSPGSIKKAFIDAFNRNMINGFSRCKDSTSAITIKKINANKSEIVFSFDIVILAMIDDCISIIRQDKHNTKERYFWNRLPDMNTFNDNFKKIIGNEMWHKLREVYLNKKTAKNSGYNNTEKKSFQLLNEAVNEVLDCFNKNE